MCCLLFSNVVQYNYNTLTGNESSKTIMERDLFDELQDAIDPVNANNEDIVETELEEQDKKPIRRRDGKLVDEDGKTYEDVCRSMGLKVPEKGHYVDNEELYAHMVKYCEERDKALAEGREKPPVDDFIGECIMKIATHLSFRPNFINYSYRQEMINDAIDNCLTYIDSFDPKKSKSAFSYITQICWCAFIRRLKLEKKQNLIRGKLMMMSPITDTMQLDDDEDGTNVMNNSTIHTYMELAQEEEDKIAAIKAEKAAEKAARREAMREKTALEEFFV